MKRLLLLLATALTVLSTFAAPPKADAQVAVVIGHPHRRYYHHRYYRRGYYHHRYYRHYHHY